MNLKLTSFQFVIFLSFSLLYTTFGVLQYVGISKSIPYEKVDNYLGKTIIYPNQEIVSSQKTSFAVDSMMRCRTIGLAAQSFLNVVNVGKLENGSIICNLAFQDQNNPQVQLGPRLGMFTFLHWDYGAYSPAENGIFYKLFGKVKPADAQKSCPGNWVVAYAITPNQMDILKKFMRANGLNVIHINAGCSKGTTPFWNNSTAPFTQPVNYDWFLGKGTHVTYNLNFWNTFYCAPKDDSPNDLVCMLNMLSLPWEEI